MFVSYTPISNIMVSTKYNFNNPGRSKVDDIIKETIKELDKK